MCGIAGFLGAPEPELLKRMTDTLQHRGPDDEGHFETPEASLGFRRLSIIDLEHGHQPMANESGSVVLIFNGEIYNYRELRAELQAQGYVFQTDSDTEVLLHAFEAWDLDAFPRLNGMWAVGILDLSGRRLVLCRDHFGIKPLYYARTPNRLTFASEIKALFRDPDLLPRVHGELLYEYLSHGLHDHREETFFAGVKHVPAAHTMVFDLDQPEALPTVRPYWKPVLSEDPSIDAQQFIDAFRTSVQRRLIADVPVGACLSGGLDSSTIVSLMTDLLKNEVPDAKSLQGRVKTFSAVFDGDPIDERAYIEEEIRATGADTDYIHPDSKTFVHELTDLIWYQDEPFVSTGPYAQWTVMQEARKHVTVVLDGQGGDELVAGYVPYQFIYLRQLLRERHYGLFLREASAARDILLPLLRRRRRAQRRPFPGGLLQAKFTQLHPTPKDTRSTDRLKERLLADVTTYSLPSLLRYEDRNSMAHSLESRVPWLDQDLVELVLRLPPGHIIRGGWSRTLLREGMQGLLPEKIRLRRWKVGFTTPETRWLFARRAAFQGLFLSPLFQSRPYWNGQRISRAFRDAALGRTDASLLLWRLINTEIWLRVFFSESLAGTTGRPQDHIAIADRWVADRLGAAARDALARYAPNDMRHLFATAQAVVYLRAPLKTPLVSAGDDLLQVLRRVTDDQLEAGDLLVLSEKIVAISQGRSFPIQEIRPRPLARFLSGHVTRTPSGIGLGIPETMELALREAGGARILYAAAVSALARPFGRRGVFYRIVPQAVAAIDGPTRGTLPPYNTHAKLGPKNPAAVAQSLSDALGVGVAIVDANDLDVSVLGASSDVDTQTVRTLFWDNPLGQGHEQTPVALIRAMGPLPKDDGADVTHLGEADESGDASVSTVRSGEA